MGVETIIAIAAVVSVAVSVVSAMNQADAAAEQKKAREDALKLQEQQRKLQEAQQQAAMERSARARRAMLINNASQNNVLYTTSSEGSINAINKNLSRDLTFAGNSSALADQADENTLRQISLDASRQESAALFSGILGVAKGGAALAGSGVFNSSVSGPNPSANFGSEINNGGTITNNQGRE